MLHLYCTFVVTLPLQIPMWHPFLWAATSFRPYPLLHRILLYVWIWRCALCGAPGLQEDSLLHPGALLDCRELLLCAWSSSSPPSALNLVPEVLFLPHFSVPSSSCFCTAIFPFCQSALRGTPSIAHSSALTMADPFWSSWCWPPLQPY